MMNNLERWESFQEHVSKKVPTISSTVYKDTKPLFDLLDDFLNLITFFEQIDSKMNNTKRIFLMDIKNNLSRAAIYFYLNDVYLDSIIFRAMIEEAYRLLIIYNYPEKEEQTVYRYSRGDMSKKFENTLSDSFSQRDQILSHRDDVNSLYGEYSSALHGRGTDESNRLFIVKNIGEEHSVNKLIDDYRTLLVFLSGALSIKLKGTTIDTSNIIFSKKISNDFLFVLDTFGDFHLVDGG
ncbi:hypothetical protein [Weissella confusa]|uniref:hypothetical protein n=1 Tax=Weissella confusa TaxID=1583 RepID=UPI001783D06F|nr:hypothetical protein [Weissella confusa]